MFAQILGLLKDESWVEGTEEGETDLSVGIE